MRTELRNRIIDRYTTWAESWGLTLAFGVTQSLEKAEQTVAEAIVALIAIENEYQEQFGEDPRTRGKGPDTPLPHTVNPVRFASTIWELANRQAYRGFGADAFFRMPAVARAAVILKAKARFSRQQVANALEITATQVDDHLENSRLLFSDGRSWLSSSPGLHVSEDRWTPDCPRWKATAPRSDEAGSKIQDVFAQYVGNDLEPEETRTLHSHLTVCTTCRTSFSHFKKQYLDWTNSVPAIEADTELRKHLKKVTRTALKLRRKGPPRLLPGIRRVLRDGTVHVFLLGALSILFILKLLSN